MLSDRRPGRPAPTLKAKSLRHEQSRADWLSARSPQGVTIASKSTGSFGGSWPKPRAKYAVVDSLR